MSILLPLSPAVTRRWIPIAFAACVAALLIAGGFMQLPARLVFKDPDEAMRLVQVRDFLAGQSWRDLVPHRLDPSFDRPMHWSRFIDLSMTALYWPLSLIMKPEHAERAMAIIWPPLTLVLCAIPLTMIARRFGSMRAALTAVILCCGVASLWQFLPGRIDHHSVQMAAALFAIAFTIQRSTPWSAGLAGVMTALALSLGIETLPYLLILACFFAVDWIAGQRLPSVRAYVIATGASATAFFALNVAPRFWTYTACDVLTFNFLAGIVVGSIGLYGASRWAELRPVSRTSRLMVCALVILGALGTSLAIEPRCAWGVIGTFDPSIRPLWFNHIVEVTTAFTIAVIQPSYAFTSFALPMVALLVIAMRGHLMLRRDDGRIVLTCFAAALLVALLQIRGAFYANVFAALIIGPALVSYAQRWTPLRRFETAPLVLAILLLVLVPVLPRLTMHITTAEASQGPAATDPIPTACRSSDSFATLATLPQGLVLAPVDTGPFILLNTQHAVVSSPYHRFDRGIVLGQSILYKMNSSEAHAALLRRGITYVAICEADMGGRLATALAKERPLWAQEVSSADAPLRIFRIVPEGQAGAAP